MIFYEHYSIIYESVLRIFPLLSIVGSSIIVYMIVSEYKKKGKQFSRPTYSHLMFTISTIDIVASCNFMLGKLMVPNSTVAGYETGGYGNFTTCTIQGLLIVWNVGCIAMYNAFLMIYFVLAVRYSIPERVVASRYEPWFHAVVLIAVVTMTVSGAALKVINPKFIMLDPNELTPTTYRDWMIHSNVSLQDLGILYPFCSIEAYPTFCNDVDTININVNNNTTSSGGGGGSTITECTRGATEGTYFVVAIGITFICCLAIIASLFLLYLTIRAQEKANRRHQFRGNNTSSTTMLSRRSSPFSRHSQRRMSLRTSTSLTHNETRQKMKLSNQVALQAVYYGVFFINTYLWIPLGAYMGNDLLAEVLVIVFNASQGLFNFCIYMKPYIARFRRERARARRRQEQGQHHRQRQSNVGLPNESIIAAFRKSLERYDFDCLDDDDDDVVVTEGSNRNDDEEAKEEGKSREIQDDVVDKEMNETSPTQQNAPTLEGE